MGGRFKSSFTPYLSTIPKEGFPISTPYAKAGSQGEKTKGPVFLNPRIRATELRLIQDGDTQIVSRQEAERLAEETGLDLLVISLESSPPVVRLIDYGKYKYEQEKKIRIAKKKQHVTEVKEVKMTVRIDDHDYVTKLNNAKRFLEQGDKVKFTLRLKGREIQHHNLGVALAQRFVVDLEEFGSVDGRIATQGRVISCVLSPKATPSVKKTSSTPKSAPKSEAVPEQETTEAPSADTNE
jgi:translation initiation factor IF-3